MFFVLLLLFACGWMDGPSVRPSVCELERVHTYKHSDICMSVPQIRSLLFFFSIRSFFPEFSFLFSLARRVGRVVSLQKHTRLLFYFLIFSQHLNHSQSFCFPVTLVLFLFYGRNADGPKKMRKNRKSSRWKICVSGKCTATKSNRCIKRLIMMTYEYTNIHI